MVVIYNRLNIEHHSNNTTIKEEIRFLLLLKKESNEISLNYDFQEVSSNFKGFENNSRGVSRGDLIQGGFKGFQGFSRGMATM